jgi:hypothetical protein
MKAVKLKSETVKLKIEAVKLKSEAVRLKITPTIAIVFGRSKIVSVLPFMFQRLPWRLQNKTCGET